MINAQKLLYLGAVSSMLLKFEHFEYLNGFFQRTFFTTAWGSISGFSKRTRNIVQV